MQLESEARLSEAGFTEIRPVTQSQRDGAYIVAFEARRRDEQVLAAFGYELEDGAVLDVGALQLRLQQAPPDARSPWLALGGWADLDSESRALVGKVKDASLSTCRVVSTLGETQIPIVHGLVLGWVPVGVRYRLAFS
jgi:hypothetical protein